VLGPDDLVFCSGTLLRATLDELIEACTAGGYRGLSLWPHHIEGARAAGRSDAEIRARLADSGVLPVEVEPCLSWLPEGSLAPEHAKLAGPPLEAMIDLAVAVGSPALLVVDGFGANADVDAIAEAFAHVCDRAGQEGLEVKLEFTPWSSVPDARTAHQVVTRAGRANGGILIDTWHHFRGANDLAQIAALPGNVVLGIQLNDASAARTGEPLPQEAMHARRLPGAGDIDLTGFVRTLDTIGSRAPIGIEVFSDAFDGLSPAEVGRRTADSGRQLLALARA
jgi:sugar phosphate isomerase/epimerase